MATIPQLDHVLSGMVAKLDRRSHLSQRDRTALLALPFRVQRFDPAKYLVREGAQPDRCALILSGYVITHKTTAEGDRQILGFHLPGDFVDLQGALLATADYNIQALTRCEVALVPVSTILALAAEHPRVGLAMWTDTLVNAAVFREWLLNVGRRDARCRIAHLLCEFVARLEAADLAVSGGFELPMTQEHLADATGLTTVHVNRTLRGLERDGLIVRDKRFVGIPDWDKLKAAAGFNALYLHLDQLPN